MPSTFEDQRKLFLVEMKPLRPSCKIKFIRRKSNLFEGSQINLRKLFLIEIKPLRFSFRIKFIEIHSKEAKSINSIKIQVS